MRSSHTLAGIETTFDEDNLVANAWLLAPGALAQKLGVAELIDQHLQLPVDAVGRANGGTKAMTVIRTMLAGGDSIADVGVLRAGAGPELFDQGRAPSTIGAKRVHLGISEDARQGVTAGWGSPTPAGRECQLNGGCPPPFF